MRKINKKNKVTFITFASTIVLIIVLITILIFATKKEAPVSIDLKKDNIVFSEDNKSINLEKDKNIKEKWNGNFYLEKDAVGSTPIVFSQDGLTLLGDVIEVKPDSSVDFLGKITKNKLEKTNFYKLMDRKYLIVSDNITNNDNLNLKDFAIVNIDKNGSGQLLNQSTSFKTIEPLKLYFDGYEFDIANEQLIIADEKIDLTKINGTTNEFKEINKKQNENKTSDQTTSDSTNSSQPDASGTNAISGSGTTGEPGTGVPGETIDVPQIKIPSLDDLKNLFTSDKNNGVDSIKPTVRINNLSSSINSVSVDYFVSDLGNAISKVYLEVENTKETKRYDLNINQTNYNILELKPNEQYKISLIHVLKKTDTTLGEKEVVDDVRNIRTKELKTKLSVREITKEKIYINLQMDRDFYIDSGKLQLLSGDNVIGELQIDRNRVVLVEGWNTSFSVPVDNREDRGFKIKFSDVMYQGQKVDISKEYYVSNPFETSVFTRLFDKIFK